MREVVRLDEQRTRVVQEPRPWFPTLPALLRKQSYDWGQSVQERFVGLLAPQPSRGQIPDQDGALELS